MTLSTDDFKFLCKLIKDRSGINLNEEKAYLLDARLLPVARKMGLVNLAELVAKIKSAPDESLLVEIIEAMTTNETSFFRDITPFNQFRDNIMPHLLQNSSDKNIRLWSAACSTGQEAYSLAMTFLENKAKYGDSKLSIVGTDIDRNVIKKAEEALYSQFEVQRGLPITMLVKYFVQQQAPADKWAIKPELKEIVKFRYLNLLENYNDMGKFDMILCRNVLIYFEPDIKMKILNKLCDCMKPHSILMLGSAETITDLSSTRLEKFEDLRGVYKLKTA